MHNILLKSDLICWSYQNKSKPDIVLHAITQWICCSWKNVTKLLPYNTTCWIMNANLWKGNHPPMYHLVIVQIGPDSTNLAYNKHKAKVTTTQQKLSKGFKAKLHFLMLS